jgi:histidine ammonia-lyase
LEQERRALADWIIGDPLHLELLEAIARRRATIGGLTEETRRRNELGRGHLQAQIDRLGTVYGVTTGFGDSCETAVEGELTDRLPKNLFRFHGCGVGEPFTTLETRAILLARLASLAEGYSAIRPEVLEAIAEFLRVDLTPVMPSMGSVGASGDLTPLSYLAAALCGEGLVSFGGREVSAREALKSARLPALELHPKESLALMNGTSAMTGVAALCLPRALRLARWCAGLSAAASDVLHGEPRHFDPRIFDAKPHPGQALAAEWIRQDLEFSRERPGRPARVQDRYSLRCAPHVIGVLLDQLPHLVRMVETEVNSAGDNPLVDPDSGDVLHGGNFYGGHVCAAMDTLKTQLANLVDLLDRQMALLCNPVTNHGLPANLVGYDSSAAAAHHGFKAMQITTSALAAEAAKLTMPASVFSRSTENHNQDKVSMGTIAARDCARILELAETTASINTLAIAQAVDLRGEATCHLRARALRDAVREEFPKVTEDRPLDIEIAWVKRRHESEALPVGDCRLADFRHPRG